MLSTSSSRDDHGEGPNHGEETARSVAAASGRPAPQVRGPYRDGPASGENISHASGSVLTSVDGGEMLRDDAHAAAASGCSPPPWMPVGAPWISVGDGESLRDDAPAARESMSLNYEPSSEPLHISVKQLSVGDGDILRLAPAARASREGAIILMSEVPQ